MGKTFTAAQMLNAGRKRPPTPAETGTELLDAQSAKDEVAVENDELVEEATKRLDDSSTNSHESLPPKQRDDSTTQLPVAKSTRRLSTVTSSSTDDKSSKPLDAQSSKPRDVSSTRRLSTVTSSAVDDQTTKPLDAATSSPLGDLAPKRPEHQSSQRLNDQPSRPLDAETFSPLGDKEPKRLSDQSPNGERSATYQRVTVFLTPAQRQWLKLSARELPDGLSGSDIVRLAVSRLAADVTDGLDLVTTLTEQAHADAEVFSGRRNRGLPPR